MALLYVVTGAGPVGWTVAEQLAGQGHRVRILTRSGSGPAHPLIERLSGDARDAALLREAFAGADAVFHCIHGSSYAAAAWEAELPAAEQAVLEAAAAAGAVVVFPESLYSYSEPDRVMTESGPRQAAGGKRGVRTMLLEAREASAAPTVSVVAGDFFGPRVRMAHGGERVVAPILAGKNVSVIGSASQPHSFTFVPDLAAAMIAAARTPSTWNTVWHAPTGPAVTQRQLTEAFARAAGRPAPKVRVLPGWLLRGAGLVSGDARELAEMLYQFERPFVMDSTLSEAALGIEPTPLDTAAAATVEWWRQQG
ncbi:NAD-dependent epimerase/dehydratase [Pseudarthrobacter chlorophenolicus A6]|uniref:NAD-dependent epimerase/dehydratase n=1 Tax=Pseudarthrobacter chlorophenolicus (strain ATCC 700700 / DSM 12829 / CIP 107037 / JCM 12360 / KCTC 9906 / NCIMB 13794 / A6) TaxID=452863 RepID=B8H6Q7_PSECP|nr:NAD-dependent epimerase/dehydratase family protein [Pseudarthrobacter chlorophenolicus]ACL41583.1 NAD-dependent epimerase/dehydratase [Pseudarthrobacter chlorophenolicus A6]SDQ61711.1 Nucleoside-diphosphate-sugar epimerase [Pseudarthrobacter chlorophenolicus]